MRLAQTHPGQFVVAQRVGDRIVSASSRKSFEEAERILAGKVGK